MAWKDYETLDLTPEKVTEEEIQKLYLKYGIENGKKRWSGLNGGKVDISKKKHSWILFYNLRKNKVDFIFYFVVFLESILTLRQT